MNINLVVLKTNQPENLVTFYEHIGFQFNHHRHGNGPLHYAAELKDFVFEIYPLPAGTSAPDSITRLGFTISNLETALEKLRTNGATIKREPMVTAWGYQALVEDPDGRKVELKEENTDFTFVIEDTFKITGRGLVMLGTLAKGTIAPGDELIFTVNGVVRRRRIVGVDDGVRQMRTTIPKIGVFLKCINDEEVDELRNRNTIDPIALVKKPQIT